MGLSLGRDRGLSGLWRERFSDNERRRSSVRFRRRTCRQFPSRLDTLPRLASGEFGYSNDATGRRRCTAGSRLDARRRWGVGRTTKHGAGPLGRYSRGRVPARSRTSARRERPDGRSCRLWPAHAARRK
ncbi:MAG TPA: hypothetical protein VG826_31975 [Pirellulales bacterium]|nr:hypothetical protein [Pirellulales bacterium]